MKVISWAATIAGIGAALIAADNAKVAGWIMLAFWALLGIVLVAGGLSLARHVLGRTPRRRLESPRRRQGLVLRNSRANVRNSRVTGMDVSIDSRRSTVDIDNTEIE